jgi:hypothetical protein
MSEDNENENHAELERALALGQAVVVSDEQLPGGRFQLAGVVMGGDIVLTQWRQDDSGEWRSSHCTILKKGTLPKLVELLRMTGYHVVSAPE